MMHPMVRMFWIGVNCGVGICNLIWIIVSFSPINITIAIVNMLVLFLLYGDYRHYYRGNTK